MKLNENLLVSKSAYKKLVTIYLSVSTSRQMFICDKNRYCKKSPNPDPINKSYKLSG